MLRFSNGWVVIAIAKARSFEIQPSKSPDFKWSDFRSPLEFRPAFEIKWGSEIWMSLNLDGQKEVGFQMVWILNGI